MGENKLGFYEFFAGGGMARIGLGQDWRCLFANEWCEKKAETYRINHKPNGELVVEDVAKLTSQQIPGEALLSWASFPCQDLSLAGNGKGLGGKRSGTFWPFWSLMSDLSDDGRPVPIIVLENVVGALTSNQGRDFQAIVDALITRGYLFGPIVMNAVNFVPQSRPRLFIIAVKSNISIDKNLISQEPSTTWHTRSIFRAYDSLNSSRKQYWVWWNIPTAEIPKHNLSTIIEEEPSDVRWHTKEETNRLLGMMTESNLNKVKESQKLKQKVVGTLYKRSRPGENGKRIQRAEVRFDQISGCLRTPVGGSSRQIIIFVNQKEIKTRLMTPREAARLMGLRDSYKLPKKYNEAYHLVGDGLVVPVVSWLEKHLLRSLAHSSLKSMGK